MKSRSLAKVSSIIKIEMNAPAKQTLPVNIAPATGPQIAEMLMRRIAIGHEKSKWQTEEPIIFNGASENE
jgi:hypothetical protein